MIPQEIKEHPYWCVWKYEVRKGKKTKPPHNPKTGRYADPSNTNTFTTYKEAVAVVEKYDGLGIACKNGLSAVDIDHCITDGKLSPMAQEVIDYFQSYTEISPSGEGIRILFYSPENVSYDKAKYFMKNSNKGLEFYLSGITTRYVTVTGNRYPQSYPIRALTQKEVNDFAEGHMKLPEKKKKPPIQEKPKCSLSDMEILDKAQGAENGDLFTALFNGDWQRQYQSQSEADLAFSNLLAFWCDREYVKMDGIFRQSGLYRPKWDENHGGKTYGEITIGKAIEDCMNTYKGYKEKNGERTEPPKEWTTPIPFDEVILPSFPSQYLPPVIRNYVKAVSDTIQAPLDMTATAALITCALCVQKKFIVKGKEGWLEPLNLYGVIVAQPAERKSAVMQAMTGFVYDYEHMVNDYLQMDIDKSEMQRNILSQQIKNMEAQLAKGTKSRKSSKDTEETKPITEDMVLSKRERLLGMEVVKPLRLIADDCTPEVLISLLAENNGKMAVLSAEGGIFEILNGRYSQSVNIDVFLKAHAGDYIRIDRKGRNSEHIPHPALSVLLTIQPVVLDGLMNNEAFRGRGLTARFLYCIPQSKVGARTFETPSIPEEHKGQFKGLIHALLGIDQETNPHIITLSETAYTLSADFAKMLEPRLKGDLEDIGDWAGKLHGAILRIAGILHIVENREKSGETPLSGQNMEAAINIGRYYLEHAKHAYTLMGADEQTDGAKYILKQLEKQEYKTLTRREIFRLCRGRFKKVDSIDPSLCTLSEYGYIRETPTEYKRTGQKPSPTFEINPMFYK